MVGGELIDDFGLPTPSPEAPNPPYYTCGPGNTIDCSWRNIHDTYNAACVKFVGEDWYQILDTVCRGIEDGFRPQESVANANNARFIISDTYLSNVMDDCLENDYTTEGVLLDSLWDGCLTAFSERPSGDRCWATPNDEELVMDHMLVGLRPVPDPGEDDAADDFGYSRLFKFATACGTPASANYAPNRPVIRCSTFYVPDYRLDHGTDGMEFPADTVVDDSACPNDPTTIVWLGGGNTYPGDLHGLPIRTLTGQVGQDYWDAKRAEWLARHPDV
jgi:hypothetical protein